MEDLAGELCFFVSLPREHITSPGTIPRGVYHGTRQISKLIFPSSDHKFPSHHPHVTLAELKHQKWCWSEWALVAPFCTPSCFTQTDNYSPAFSLLESIFLPLG